MIVIMALGYTMGFFIPIFFPLCFVAMLILYVFLKLSLAFQWRKPTIISERFDERLTYRIQFLFVMMYLVCITLMLMFDTRFWNSNSLAIIE